MNGLVIIYLACFALGITYAVISFLIGGLSHSAQVHHLGSHIAHPVNGHVHTVGGNAAEGAHSGHIHIGHTHIGHQDIVHPAEHNASQNGNGSNDDQTTHLNILHYIDPMSVSGFLIGFGGAGLLSQALHAAMIYGLLTAIAAGGAMWTGAWLLINRVFGAASTSSHNVLEDLIGLNALVTAPISQDHPGMICYVVAGSRQTIRAINEEEGVIPPGADVRIHRLDNNIARVMRIH